MRKVAAGYEYTRYAYANGGPGEIWVGNFLEYIRSRRDLRVSQGAQGHQD